MRAMVLSLLLVVAGSAEAGQRVYKGREAAALRCADMIAQTAVTLYDAGMMDRNDSRAMMAVTVLILEHHVSGTRSEKMRALKEVRKRHSTSETLEDYKRHALDCVKRFPIGGAG